MKSPVFCTTLLIRKISWPQDALADTVSSRNGGSNLGPSSLLSSISTIADQKSIQITSSITFLRPHLHLTLSPKNYQILLENENSNCKFFTQVTFRRFYLKYTNGYTRTSLLSYLAQNLSKIWLFFSNIYQFIPPPPQYTSLWLQYRKDIEV